MPNITIKLPANALSANTLQQLLAAVDCAAVEATGLGSDPRQRLLCWVMLDEVPAAHWLCGGQSNFDQVVPCHIQVLAPAGELDAGRRAHYAAALHKAIAGCLGAQDPVLMTSIVISDVMDGTWAANGDIWHLADFIRVAGYARQEVVADAAGTLLPN
ncbi:tautomerase family protein [Pseudomonas palleroniana]|uniref:tautomerase family protein n=1 Tax=Pseudomonas palleroniana TaxID=191390 RepID=UPI001FCAFA1F|nr:tautomerase family protein [Pseudomonas palleroniana]UOK36101.1 tautomerase family protein [Pseudomonas palleroniana]